MGLIKITRGWSVSAPEDRKKKIILLFVIGKTARIKKVQFRGQFYRDEEDNIDYFKKNISGLRPT